MTRKLSVRLSTLFIATAVSACAATGYERGAWQRMAEIRKGAAAGAQSGTGEIGRDAQLSPFDGPAAGSTGQDIALDGSLARYLAYAAANNPALQAAFEDWRAAVHGIARARRLPEPTLSYSAFVRRIETRVGPQRQRFGLRQMLPWPGKLRAGADAAASAAEVQERRFQARGLRVQKDVAEAYWSLWLLGRTRAIKEEQRVLLVQLAEMLRGRIAVGSGSLAELAQVDLEVSRLDDALTGLEEDQRQAQADLRYAVGAPAGTAMTMADAPPVLGLPGPRVSELRALARGNPEVMTHEATAAMSEHRARRAAAEGRPSLIVGLDYIDIGESVMPEAPDSGKDAIAVNVAVSLPLWQGSYGSERARARAEAAAARARRRDAESRAEAMVERALAHVHHCVHRVDLYEKTLIPQGETVYQAIIGEYQTGGSALASALMAHRNLLDMRLLHARNQAAHAQSWARLEAIVGREITRNGSHH